MAGGRAPNLTEKLASALLALVRQDEDGRLVPVIDRERARGLSAAQIVGLFDFDHYPIARALFDESVPQDVVNHPTNLAPLVRAEHREKTARKDIPAIAKSRRIAPKQAAFRRRLLAKAGQDVVEAAPTRAAKRKIPSRPFPKASRPFPKRQK